MADAVPDSRLVGDRSLRVGVIGAGMAGILAVIKLREAGITDIVCFEKADRVGGTWRENTYPGIGCDVPSHVYSYSFAPNPDFTRMFSPGHEIQAARLFAESLRACPWDYWSGMLPDALSPSVSIGVSAALPGVGLHTLMNMADEALYDAKNAGRNQVCVYGTKPAAAPSATVHRIKVPR